MNGKNFLAAAILCTALIFGLSGTSSAAEISSDFSTMQVESQVLSHHRHMPPPRHHNYDREYYGRTGYGNRHDNNRSSYSNTRNKKVNVNITVIRRV